MNVSAPGFVPSLVANTPLVDHSLATLRETRGQAEEDAAIHAMEVHYLFTQTFKAYARR